MRIYEGFNFSVYFRKYLEINGIKIVAVANLLDINYQTLQSKLKRDNFTYAEVLFLDKHYDLGYINNFYQYLVIKKENGI